MANLGGLKIASAPAAFAEIARKHNELVELIENIEGSLGIDIQITHSPAPKRKTELGKPKEKPRGKIKVSINPTGAAGLGGGSSLLSYTFTACVSGSPMSFDIPITRGPY